DGPPLILGTVPDVTASEGVRLTNIEVAQFTDPNPRAVPGDLAAMVLDWGDGTSGAATIVEAYIDGAGAHFFVLASHTYTDPLGPGSNITVQIQDVTCTDPPVTVDTPVTVDAGAILVTAPALVIPADKTIPAGTPVGSFTDTGGADPVSAYDNSFVRFPGADADTPLAMVRNGNSFTLETDVDTTFVG